ncbi:MAG: L,D-transpeptidase family protein [Anaerolineae bacterium]
MQYYIEWIVIGALTLVTAIMLTLAPPATQGEALPLAAALGTATPTASPTAVPTSTPSATPTSTFTATLTPSPSPSPTMTPSPFSFDTRADLPRYIYVDQETQHMYVFEHGELVREVPCSTGIPDPDKYTPAWEGRVGEYWGTFYAFDVYADEAWYLYKSAGSILVHSLPYTWEEDEKLYQGWEDLGVRPSSHGCIRIAPEDAVWLTAWNPEGVLMTVTEPYRDKWLGDTTSQPTAEPE